MLASAVVLSGAGPCVAADVEQYRNYAGANAIGEVAAYSSLLGWAENT